MSRFDGIGGVLSGPREAARPVRHKGAMHPPCQPPGAISGIGVTHWRHAGYVPPHQPPPRRSHARCCNSYQASGAIRRRATLPGLRNGRRAADQTGAGRGSGGSPLGSAFARGWCRNFRHGAEIPGSRGGRRGPTADENLPPQSPATLLLTTQSCEGKASRHTLCFPRYRPRPSRPRPTGSPAASPGEQSPVAHAQVAQRPSRPLAPPTPSSPFAHAHRPKRSRVAHLGAFFFSPSCRWPARPPGLLLHLNRA
jgi:hypothetical protein